MKKFLIPILLMVMLPGLSACTQTDVVGKASVQSFAAIAAMADVTADESFGGFALTAPDGSARFLLSRNFAATPTYDVALEFPAAPFLSAGLDASQLPDSMLVADKIVVGTDYGSQDFKDAAQASLSAAYEQLVRKNGQAIGYHKALDHYGIDLGGGNLFEWAKDLKTNDKDIVFVLDPQPFLDAGVDPAAVEGWIFAKVETMDKNGNMLEVDKLLKPFDLQ
ncbi:MAG: hypothetical protein PHQ83_06390 [Eubacteriales bacterium]|nr:hypothetical protein [Eubacteriales bacterium]